MNLSRFSILTLLLGALVLHATIGSAAPRRDPVNARKYVQCMEMAREDPDAAFDWAMDWRDIGGKEAARHCIGVALIGLKLYKEAEVSIKNYLSVEEKYEQPVPDPDSGHFVLANIFSAMGKHEQALQEYKLAGNTPTIKGEAHNNRALIFIKKKSFNLALEELHQAIIVSPNLIDAHYNLGNLLMQTKGDPIKARWHLEKALKLSTSKEGADRIKRTLSALP